MSRYALNHAAAVFALAQLSAVAAAIAALVLPPYWSGYACALLSVLGGFGAAHLGDAL